MIICIILGILLLFRLFVEFLNSITIVLFIYKVFCVSVILQLFVWNFFQISQLFTLLYLYENYCVFSYYLFIICEFSNYCLYIFHSYSVFSFNCGCSVFWIFLLFNLLYLNSFTEAFVIFIINHLLHTSLLIISMLHQPVSWYLLLESCQTLDLAILYTGKCYWSILILKFEYLLHKYWQLLWSSIICIYIQFLSLYY